MVGEKMMKIKILNEFKNKDGIDCITISKIDYNFLYDMSDLLSSIQDDLFEIRKMLELKRKVYEQRQKSSV